jgi:hypothetical protein
MNQEKEYDMLKLRVPENSIVYLKAFSDQIPQVTVIRERSGHPQEAF